MSDDALPNPRLPRQHPPLMDVSFAALGWLHRAAQAVGSDRFFEALDRAQFYLDRTAELAHTPAERAVWEGLQHILGELITADRAARTLLDASCAGMDAVVATEFVEMCEAADDPIDPAV